MNDANPQEKRITTVWNENETSPLSILGMEIQLPAIAPSMTLRITKTRKEKRRRIKINIKMNSMKMLMKTQMINRRKRRRNSI